jgi:hypothetical protein
VTRKRTPKETLDVIERSAEEDEVERILALHGEDLDRELAGAGFDPKAERERGDALAEKLGVKAWPPPIELGARATRNVRKRWVVMLAVAAGALAASVPLVVMLVKPPPDSTSPSGQASAQRRRAAQACEERHWVECAQALDGAKALDPKGEDSPSVKKLRQAIEECRR